MRLIAKIDDPEKGREFAAFLETEGIKNLCEAEEGTSHICIWVIDENDILLARQWFEEFKNQPDKLWSKKRHSYAEELRNAAKKKLEGSTMSRPNFSRAASTAGAAITVFLLVVCCLLFGWGELEKSDIARKSGGAVYYLPTAQRELMYDMPESQRFQWRGFYELSQVRTQKSIPLWAPYDGPMFEKIKQGEYWRIITPMLLHGSVLHLLFNMMWLYSLGKQMEQKLGLWRYVLFIVLTSAIPNTLQYLMSGYQFVGISGVICGMLGYVWTRQQIAAWEGYNLPNSTAAFLAIFVLGVAALQTVSYFYTLSGGASFALGIANTAHIAGGVVGAIIARIPGFGMKQ